MVEVRVFLPCGSVNAIAVTSIYAAQAAFALEVRNDVVGALLLPGLWPCGIQIEFTDILKLIVIPLGIE